MPVDPKEHRLKRKIAQRQHTKRTLRRLRESDDLFLNNSISRGQQTTIANGQEW